MFELYETLMTFLCKELFLIFRKIGEIDISKLVPLSLKKTLREAVNLTYMMVDQVDYNNSIIELSKPLLKLDNYTKFVSDLEAFTSSIFSQNKLNDDLKFIIKLIKPIKEKVLEYRKLTDLLGQVRAKFELLNKTRTISSGLLRMLREFDAVELVIKNKTGTLLAVDENYDLVMSWVVPQIANLTTKSVKTLERELLPCDDLAEAFSKSTNGVCGDILPPFNAFIFCFAWYIVWFQLLFLSAWLLLCKVHEQQQESTSG